jgi:hypothetical protein
VLEVTRRLLDPDDVVVRRRSRPTVLGAMSTAAGTGTL